MTSRRSLAVLVASLAIEGIAFQTPTPPCKRTSTIIQRAESPWDEGSMPLKQRKPTSNDVPTWLKQLNKLGAKLSLRDAAWRKSITDQTADISLAAYEDQVNGPAQAALRAIDSVVAAETSRAQRILEDVESGGSGFVRPKDAPVRGPLGKAEREAVLVLESLVAVQLLLFR